MIAPALATQKKVLRRERWKLLRQVSDALDRPMTALAFVWLVLLIIDLVYGLNAGASLLSYGIWVLFVLHFLLELWIAPSKRAYLKQNWLTAIALLLPAFRVLRVVRAFRFLRVARAARSLSLVRLVTSLNRGMHALKASVSQSALGYVVALTVLVNFAGAAGMYSFENPHSLADAGYPATKNAGIGSYGEAVWWTAMMLTTMGSDYFPKTNEGRLLAWLLALYGFAIFGYITATVASFLVKGRDARAAATAQSRAEANAATNASELAALRGEIAALRRELAATRRRTAASTRN